MKALFQRTVETGYERTLARRGGAVTFSALAFNGER
jgi:hypothetical protein